MLDLTVIMAAVSVIGSVIVFAVLGYRVTRLMKTCNSQEQN